MTDRPAVSPSHAFLVPLQLLAIVVIVLCGQGVSQAQSIPGLGGESSGSPVLVEKGVIRETAITSFRQLAAKMMGRESSGDSEEIGQATSKVENRYVEALDNALSELEGDGLLTASEVNERLGDLRQDYRKELDTVLTAVRDGYPPPPLRTGEELTADHVREMTAYTLLIRNPPLSWLYFLICVVAGILLAWALNLGAYRLGEQVGGGGLPGIGSVLRSLAGPLYLIAIGAGLQFGFDAIWVPSSIRGALQGTISVILISALFWFFWNASPGTATAILKMIGTSYTRKFDDHAHNILLRLIRVVIIVLLVLVVVRLIFESSLSNMLTGLGVLGVLLYFILRGTIENIAASFTLFSDQPFKVGDLVIFNDQWGTIEDIGFRSTGFRNFDGYLITIPNSELIDVAIVNAGARPSIRRRFHIGLTYHTPADKVREAINIIRDILKDHQGMPEDGEPNVEFEQFGKYDLQILVQYFYSPPDYWEAMAFDTKVNLAIIERLGEADIEIAFPTETHIVEGSERHSLLVENKSADDPDEEDESPGENAEGQANETGSASAIKEADHGGDDGKRDDQKTANERAARKDEKRPTGGNDGATRGDGE